jgi:hypothetical protein
MRAGFLLAEDEAVKARFDGMMLPTDRGSTKVTVRFADPIKEVEKELPLITIQNIGISHARNRQHSDQNVFLVNSAIASPVSRSRRVMTMNYWPDETDDVSTLISPNQPFARTRELIPVDLLYQISTYTRHPIQDRMLQAALMRPGRMPFRWGFIHIPIDGSTRRFDLLSVQPADVRDQETGYQKIMFRKIYTVLVNSELPSLDLAEFGEVSTVVVNVHNK